MGVSFILNFVHFVAEITAVAMDGIFPCFLWWEKEIQSKENEEGLLQRPNKFLWCLSGNMSLLISEPSPSKRTGFF